MARVAPRRRGSRRPGSRPRAPSFSISLIETIDAKPEDVAHREVDPARDDDEELGGREEEDQHAVEEEDLQRVGVGEALGAEAEVDRLEDKEIRTHLPPEEGGEGLPSAAAAPAKRSFPSAYLASGKSLSMTTATTRRTPTAI